MSKIIIGIHGLGNKPSHDLLEKWWREAICEGLNHINKPHKFLKFELVGWADLLHPQPEEPDTIKEPYKPATTWLKPKLENKRKKIQKFIEEQLEKILINPNGTINFSSITDKIINRYFRDLNVYYSDEYVAGQNILFRDAIRQRLFNVLKKHQGKSILLIAHSMGSIIAFDVLRNNLEKISIDKFLTIGSPLGLPFITSKIVKEHGNKTVLSVPENIKKNWYNFSDLEDRVAINFDLSDDYLPSQNGLEIEDFEIYNNYQIDNERNPHKAYGYLRMPELAEQIDNFLIDDKNKLSIWLMRKINKFLK